MSSVVPFRLGGHVALDFVNTVNSWVPAPTKDYLTGYKDLVRWTNEVGLLQHDQALALVDLPIDVAHRCYCEALHLRASLRQIFLAAIVGKPVEAEHLEALNIYASEARTCECLKQVAGGQGFAWEDSAPINPRTPLLRIAARAAELIVCGPRDRLKQCPPPDGCGWLFLDESRNRSRRWCSMELCGNRSKVRRFADAHRTPRA